MQEGQSSGQPWPKKINDSVWEFCAPKGSQQELGPRWLFNSSFSESLLPPPLSSVSSPSAAPPLDAEVTGKDIDNVTSHGQHQRSVSSSALGSSTDEDADRELAEKRRRKKKKKRKKREEDERRVEKRKRKERENDADTRKIGALDSTSVQRKGGVTAWADLNKSLPKEYYFDTRGDRDNLAFGSLYRLDVARYRRQDFYGVSEQLHSQRTKLLDVEGDGIVQDDAVKNVGRYWSPKYSSLERKRKLRHLRLCKGYAGHKVSSAALGDFVPLETEKAVKNTVIEGEVREVGETWQEYVTRKTREYNEQTRERSHDESLWISFANFQDELIQATEKKAAIQQAVEKKIAILEKALHLHSDSEDLLLLYLETCQRRDTTGALVSKWEDAVSRHSSSLRMWREFLRFRCTQFSTFSVSSIRGLYIRGLQALSASRNRIQTKGNDEIDYDAQYLEAEQALVSIFVDLCRFTWQAGHHELAVGFLQAGIEYSLFPPPIQLSESNKMRLFEAFWDSGAPRIGENGALGWVTWLEKEEEQVQRARELNLSGEDDSEEPQGGGWTGWSEPEMDDSKPNETLVDNEIVDMEEDSKADADVVMEEDDAALLEKLGLSLDPGKEVEINDTSVWRRWSEREAQRDREQWLPLRTKHANDTHGAVAPEDDGDQLERIIHFEDIKESLLTLRSKQARLSLACEILDFCDGPLSEWCCSNSWSHKTAMESLESLKGTLLADIGNSDRGDYSKKYTLADLVGDSPWYEKSHGGATFLRNAFYLVRTVFPDDRRLLRGLFKAEDLAAEETGLLAGSVSASRALGKKLLKIHRQDLSLWGAYACIEAVAGNITTARKVFDTTLASLGALPKEVQQDAPVLYLTYAELELARSSCDTGAEKRALYILCCVGSGSEYSPQSFPDVIPATQLLRCQRGYREQLQRVRANDRGNLSPTGAALISCAALFEQLTTGWAAAASVFEEGLAMTLPGKRQQNLESELLLLRYVKMLENLKPAAKPARLRSTILRGFMEYPCNAKLTGAYIRSAAHSGMTHKLRRFVDDASKRNPSTMLWLFALSCELWRPGAGPRIHSLFERALESRETRQSVLIWRCYLAYELHVASNPDAARRVYFRAIHACPWSKSLWTDGFTKLGSILCAKEQSEFVDIMREKELRIRTDVYEILLEDAQDEDMVQ